jgi:activator of HSP90 ATPase
MSQKFTVSDVIPASPRAVYDAWLDGKQHSRMTGAAATGSAKVGAAFTTWDGYVRGKNLELERGKRIVQSWRSSDFAEGDRDSMITVTLKPVDGGTKITLLHTRIPDGQNEYRQGWLDYYFAPMKDYFAKSRKKRR